MSGHFIRATFKFACVAVIAICLLSTARPLLAQRGFEPLPTQGNFVFVTPPDGRDWFDLLLHQGVIVRPVPGGLRITFGTAEEDDFLLHAIDTIGA